MIGAIYLTFFDWMYHYKMTSWLSDYNPSVFFKYPYKFIVFHKSKVIYLLPQHLCKKPFFSKKKTYLIMGYELWTMRYGLLVMGYEIWVMYSGYEIWAMGYEILIRNIYISYPIAHNP